MKSLLLAFLSVVYATLLTRRTLDMIPESIWLDIVKSLDYDGLIALNATSKAFFPIIHRIFDFKEACGVLGADRWPNLRLNLNNQLVYDSRCIQHLRQNSFLYSEITLIQRGKFVYENQLLLQNAIKKMDPQTAVNIYLEGEFSQSQIQSYFSGIENWKLSLTLKESPLPQPVIDSLREYLKDLNIIKLEILYSYHSQIIVGDLITSFGKLKTLNSLTVKRTSPYSIRSSHIIESFRGSKLTHFEISGLPTDFDRELNVDEVLVTLVKALPSTITSLSCSQFREYNIWHMKSKVLNVVFQNRQIVNLTLNGFLHGLETVGILLLAKNLKNGYLKHLSLDNSPPDHDWEGIRIISVALPHSKLISLSLVNQFSYRVEYLELVMNAVSKTPTLKLLDLSRNRVGENGCVSISRNLGSLERLVLKDNNLGNLSHFNCLGDVCAQIFSKRIADSNLKYLSLENNNIHVSGVQYLSKAAENIFAKGNSVELRVGGNGHAAQRLIVDGKKSVFRII